MNGMIYKTSLKSPMLNLYAGLFEPPQLMDSCHAFQHVLLLLAVIFILLLVTFTAHCTELSQC